MVNTFLDSPLKNLYWIEKNCSLASPLKDQVLNLKQKSRFLRTYLIYRGISSEEAITSTSGSVISNVELEAAFRSATDDLSSACSLPPDFEKTDSAAHYMLEKVKLCDPEIRKAYAILWEQPCREVNYPLNPESSMDFIDSILENLEDLLGSKSLVSVVKKTVEILKEMLSFLRNFVDITAKKSISDQEMGAFLSNVHVSATSAACFSYLCWDSQPDQISGCRMDIKISDLIQKIKPSTSDHMEIYIGLLKASIQTGSEATEMEEITSFVNFLLENSVDSLKDQIDSFNEELVYLIAFLIDLPDECTGDLERISTDIKVVAKEAALFRVNEEQVKEMNLVISRLLQKTKLIKAEIILLRLLDSEDTLMFPMKDQMANLHEGLLFLRTFLMETTDIENEIDDWKVFWVHLEYVVSESLSLISSCGGSEMTEEDMASELNLSIFMLVVKIKLIKAEVMLVELIKFPEVGLIVHMKDEVKTLLEGVRFLRMFLMNPPKEEGEELLVAKSEAMANEVASLIFSFHYHVMKEGVASETNNLLPELVEKIEFLKADIKDACLQVPNLPEAEGLVVLIRSLVEDMNKLLNQEAKSRAFGKLRIEVLLEEFNFLKSFLTDTEELYNEHQELKDVWACITDVSCETKYIIGYLLVTVRDEDLSWYLMLWISFAMQDIKLIRAKVMKIYDKERFGMGGAHPHSGVVASARPLTTNDVVVEHHDSMCMIIDRLTSGTNNISILSIVGMFGVGKKSLAQRVYNNRLVVQHFPIRAFCHMTQKYKKRDLLLDILSDITVVTDRMYEMADDELAGELYNYLKQRRYLIVVDDVWYAETLEDLRSLPDTNSGSRILLTTRFMQLAFRADPTSSPFQLFLLRKDECWDLFRNRIFGGEAHDMSFELVGKEIINRCIRLPFAISLIAGLLANTERELSWWQQVEQSLSTYRDESQFQGVMEFVYDTLPGHLKTCFLCFGGFPEAKEIPARQLSQLWIAKGLVQETDSKTSEDVVEEYLLDLISRNLVNVSKTRYNGRVRACRVHKLIRQLCIVKQAELGRYI